VALTFALHIGPAPLPVGASALGLRRGRIGQAEQDIEERQRRQQPQHVASAPRFCEGANESVKALRIHATSRTQPPRPPSWRAAEVMLNA
jgi:hypothetical protein